MNVAEDVKFEYILPFSQPNSHQQVGPSRWPLKSQKTLQLPGA